MRASVEQFSATQPGIRMSNQRPKLWRTRGRTQADNMIKETVETKLFQFENVYFYAIRLFISGPMHR